jgi:hypothetical protein
MNSRATPKNPSGRGGQGKRCQIVRTLPEAGEDPLPAKKLAVSNGGFTLGPQERSKQAHGLAGAFGSQRGAAAERFRVMKLSLDAGWWAGHLRHTVGALRTPYNYINLCICIAQTHIIILYLRPVL